MMLTKSYGREFVQIIGKAKDGEWDIYRWVSPFDPQHISQTTSPENDLLKMSKVGE